MNRKPLTPEQAALAGRLLPLAREESRIAATHPRRRHRREELESAFGLALVTAARSHRPDGGASFTTWAHHAFRSASRMALKADRPRGYREYRDERNPRPPFAVFALKTDNDGPGTPQECLARAGDTHRVDDADEVEFLLAGLDDAGRALVRDYYWHGLSLERIAEGLGITRQGVAARLRKALGLLRERAAPQP